MASGAPARSPVDDARDELIRSLRGEVSERVRLQHQIAVLAGGSIAIAASLLGEDVEPSPWLYLGLSILFIGFGFWMLNQDRIIVTAVHYVLLRGDAHAEVQAEWEVHLRDANRNLGISLTGVAAALRGMAPYAIPVLGTVGASWAFVAQDDAAWPTVVVPTLLTAAFLREVFRVIGAYQALGRVAAAEAPSGAPAGQVGP
jgi:hypothetical protein